MNNEDKNNSKTPVVKNNAVLTKSVKDFVTKWKDRESETSIPFYFEVDKENHLKLVPKKIKGIDSKEMDDIVGAELYRITGISDSFMAEIMIKQTATSIVSTTEDPKIEENAANVILLLLKEMEPKDPFEAMLALRMISLHNISMRELAMANLSDSMDSCNQFVSRVTKLTRLWNEAKDRWDKHRKKEDQKVVVEHVHVNEGGKAIVGSFTHGGGIQKNEEDPHGKV